MGSGKRHSPQQASAQVEYEVPPRPRRESPERRDQRVRKHVAQAREYWAKGAEHLRENDLCQAADKGWGTVAQLTKAVATMRGWDHYDHESIRECVGEIRRELSGQELEIIRGMRAAEHLHGQFYEVFMDLQAVGASLQDVVPLLEILWNLLPDEYTGGGTFAGQTSG